MTQQTAELLSDYNYSLEVYEDYSGRGMFGETTQGVVGSQQSFNRALAEIMVDADEDERKIVANELESLRIDNMGLDLIFY